ncbi:MAG: hypothetical protein J6A44_01960 [Paludibacteraceae bacterium]|nr:hypothetical protein [Paludibacteraceae bacterium]
MCRLLYLLFFCTIAIPLWAWRAWPLPMDSADNRRDTLTYFGEFMGLASSGRFAPFWMSANRDGVVSVSPYSAHLRGGIEKEAVRDARWWDYSYGVDVRLQITDNRLQRVGNNGQSVGCGLQIVKLYAYARLWCFDVTVGVKPFDMGNQDYELSAGGFLFSRNASSMPRISVGIDRYTAFPFTYGYMEVKGGITHGWFVDNIGTKKTLLHHKYLGVRLGGKLPVNINYEFHHATQWGGVSERYGELGASLRDWWTVFKASSGGVMGNDQINAMGNHIGSQMLGVEVKYGGWYVNAYWQSLFEDGPIRYMWNAKNAVDGLWGVALKQAHWKFVEALTYEFFATTDQSGPVHDLDGIIFGGRDNYFNNAIYPQGWSHFGQTIGNPFITSPIYTSSLTILNNRTFTHHIALKGDIYGFKYLLRYSNSNNFGTYKFPMRTYNNSVYCSVQKLVPQAWNLTFGVSIGGDIGTQFGNSFGAMVTVSRSGIIWKSKK